LRRVGNLIFALLLSFFASRKVRDTASGMRVVRASSLRKIMPLPDGMHFTPAMSARAILSSGLKIAEEDMPYHERDGESKLRVVSQPSVTDRALRGFFSSRWFWIAPAVLLALGSALVTSSFVEWLRYREIFKHWSRFVAMALCASCAVILSVTKILDYTLNLV